jgi:hypothetical protein
MKIAATDNRELKCSVEGPFDYDRNFIDWISSQEVFPDLQKRQSEIGVHSDLLKEYYGDILRYAKQ